MNGDIHEHMHLRRRAHRPNSVHYAYPSSNRLVRLIDGIMYVVGVVGPLVSIPQIMEVYVRQNVEGLSMLSWTGYSFLSAFWVVYAILHREPPLIITQLLWFCINVSVVFGIILYR